MKMKVASAMALLLIVACGSSRDYLFDIPNASVTNHNEIKGVYGNNFNSGRLSIIVRLEVGNDYLVIAARCSEGDKTVTLSQKTKVTVTRSSITLSEDIKAKETKVKKTKYCKIKKVAKGTQYMRVLKNGRAHLNLGGYVFPKLAELDQLKH